jgi:sugar (pentulose or hexulose) kinase
VIVLDVGKTASKAILCDAQGAVLARREHHNAVLSSEGNRVLDTAGVERWLAAVLRELGALHPVRAIVPVGHGAAAAMIREGRLIRPPLDYEQAIRPAVRAAYELERDPFELSGSPSLPDGLNLGAQLYALETLDPGLRSADTLIVPWPQYWAWLLSGVASSEVTSLGCHTDLWRPFEAAPTAIARRHGWASRLAPLRKADDVLGVITREWAERTGLSPDVEILCGLHDSNAALEAARGFAEISGREATIVSTGTWFVAMRSLGNGAALDMGSLPEARDCLVNVDVAGRPVPSARFMGGREIQLLTGPGGAQIDEPAAQDAMVRALPDLIRDGIMVLPTMAPGVGPFPATKGRWIGEPAAPMARAAAIALYAALVVDCSLELIGARERLLIEGRFTRSRVFVRALATLRPDMRVFLTDGLDLAFGACRLIAPHLQPPRLLEEAAPLDLDLATYRVRWRTCAEAD